MTKTTGALPQPFGWLGNMAINKEELKTWLKQSLESQNLPMEISRIDVLDKVAIILLIPTSKISKLD